MWDPFPLVRLHQLLQPLHPHTPTDNLPHTGHQTIHTLRHPQIGRILLHVERLDLDREPRQEDRQPNLIRHLALRRLGDIIAKLMRLTVLVGDVALLQPVDGIRVGHAHERPRGRFECRVELGDEAGDEGIGEGVVDRAADEFLEVHEELIKVDEGELGFDVGIFRQVTAGQGLLGAERLLDAENVAQRRETGFEVELGGLGEVGLLAVVVELEEGAASFDLGLDHAGRGDLKQAELLVALTERPHHTSSDLQDRTGLLSAEDEMPVVVLCLGVRVLRDDVGDGLVTARRLPDDLEVVGVQLVAVRRVRAFWDGRDDAVDGDGRLDGQGHRIVGLGQALGKDALQISGSVAQRDEDQLLLDPQPVDPAGNPYPLPTTGNAVPDLDVDGSGQGGVFADHDLLGLLQLGVTGSLLLGLLSSDFSLLGQLLEVGSVQVGGLFQGSFGGGHVGFAGVVLGAGERFADLELCVWVGLVGVRQGADQGLVRLVLGARRFWGVDASILVDVDCRELV